MKISDERLRYWTETYKRGIEICGKNEVSEEFLSIFTELQQLREERRWRKLGVDEPDFQSDYQVYYGGQIDRYDIWGYDKSGGWYVGAGEPVDRVKAMDIIHKFSESGFYFRPLPMDLPEGDLG